MGVTNASRFGVQNKNNFRKHKLLICCRSRAVSFTTRAPTLLPPQRLISKSFAAKNFHPRVYQKHFLFIRQHATPTAQTRIILYERGTEGNERDSEGNEQPAQKSSQNVDTERFSFASHLTASWKTWFELWVTRDRGLSSKSVESIKLYGNLYSPPPTEVALASAYYHTHFPTV